MALHRDRERAVALARSERAEAAMAELGRVLAELRAEAVS